MTLYSKVTTIKVQSTIGRILEIRINKNAEYSTWNMDFSFIILSLGMNKSRSNLI